MSSPVLAPTQTRFLLRELDKQNLVCFDVETTMSDKIPYEIGAVKLYNLEPVDEFEIRFDPEVKFDNWITGVCSGDVEGERIFPEIWPEFSKFMQGNVLVCSNPGADMNALYRACVRYSGCDWIDRRFFATFPLAKQLGLPTKISDLCEFFDTGNRPDHTAIKDAYAVSEVLDGFKKYADHLALDTIITANQYYPRTQH